MPRLTFRCALARASSVLLVLPAAASAQSERVASEFATRLEAALAGTPADWDRLWMPGARDAAARRLDVRRASLFRWTAPRVEVESARVVTGARGSEVVVDLVVRGEARWEPRAWGVATAFWALMTDDERETNAIVRREAWRLASAGSGWGAVERVLLSPVEVVEAKIEAGVYPGQGALLVECSYYVRSLANGVENVRFLLDRRAEIYDVQVDGTQARVARGGELGAFGLEGFSPEVESSLRFPRPLAAGEEALVTFKIREPLVHLTGEGFVSTFPFRDGPFRERAWYPILAPARCAGEAGSAPLVELGVRWPRGAFESFSLSGKPVLSRDVRQEDLRNEEDRQRATLEDPRGADFVLGERGTVIEAEPPVGSLDPHRRSRAALVDPLLSASVYSSEDLETALEELLPLDQDLLDIFRDADSEGDAEQSSDDRTSG